MYLVADVSTSGIRTSLVASDGAVRSPSHDRFDVATACRGRAPMDVLTGRVLTGFARVLASDRDGSSSVTGIVLTGSASNVVGADAGGNAVTSVLSWQDRRAWREAATMGRRGYDCATEDAIPKMMWLHAHERSRWPLDVRLAEVADCLTFKITGEWSADLSTRLRKYGADPSGLPPSAAVLASRVPDLLDRLPEPVLETGGQAGRLNATLAGRLGIRRVPVFRAGYDTVAQMLGLGFAACEEDLVGLSLGSSCGIFARSESGIAAKKGMWKVYESLIPRVSVYASGHAFGGLAVDQLISRFVASADGHHLQFREELEAEASALSFCETPLFTLNGNRMLDRVFIAQLPAILFRRPAAVAYRVLLQTLAAELAILYHALVLDTGLRPQRLVAGGGLASSRLLLTLLANMLNLPVCVAMSPAHSTMRGAAIGAVAGGALPSGCAAMVRFDPRPIEPCDDGQVCRRFLERYQANRRPAKRAA